MKYLVLSLYLIATTVEAKEITWKAGKIEHQLIKINDDGYLSKMCLKSCELKKNAKKALSDLNQDQLIGGKDPASIVCKMIGAEVSYLSSNLNEEAFCVKGKEIISLSLLLL